MTRPVQNVNCALGTSTFRSETNIDDANDLIDRRTTKTISWLSARDRKKGADNSISQFRFIFPSINFELSQ